MYTMHAFFRHSLSVTTTDDATKAFTWFNTIKAEGGKDLMGAFLYGPGEQPRHPAIVPKGALLTCLGSWSKAV